jgi:hypothetical protein
MYVISKLNRKKEQDFLHYYAQNTVTDDKDIW